MVSYLVYTIWHKRTRSVHLATAARVCTEHAAKQIFYRCVMDSLLSRSKGYLVELQLQDTVHGYTRLEHYTIHALIPLQHIHAPLLCSRDINYMLSIHNVFNMFVTCLSLSLSLFFCSRRPSGKCQRNHSSGQTRHYATRGQNCHKNNKKTATKTDLMRADQKAGPKSWMPKMEKQSSMQQIQLTTRQSLKRNQIARGSCHPLGKALNAIDCAWVQANARVFRPQR